MSAKPPNAPTLQTARHRRPSLYVHSYGNTRAPTPGTSDRGKPAPKTLAATTANAPAPHACLDSTPRPSSIRDPRTRQDANGNNVSNASALCSKRLLPGTTGNRANAHPTVHATEDQRASQKTRTEEKADMKLAATATPAQHTDESAEPYQPWQRPPKNELWTWRRTASGTGKCALSV